jgi:uncharacterized membrane protein
MSGIKAHFQRKFLAGALAAIPVAVTIFILFYVDSQVRVVFGVRYPFLGIVVALVIIYGLGVFVTSLIGRQLLHFVDWTLTHLPGVGDLYRSWKQVAVTPDMSIGVFARVVILPDETGRLRMLGFSSGKPLEGTEDTLCVFVPASPNPTSGRIFFVAQADCRFVDIGAQEALKLIISGGNYIPGPLGAALAR